MFNKNTFVVALSAIVTVAASGNAQALTPTSSTSPISFSMSFGQAGMNGEEDKGLYSDYARDNETFTMDFNNLTTGNLSKTTFSGKGVSATYRFIGNNTSLANPNSQQVFNGIRRDMWAPVYSSGIDETKVQERRTQFTTEETNRITNQVRNNRTNTIRNDETTRFNNQVIATLNAERLTGAARTNRQNVLNQGRTDAVNAATTQRLNQEIQAALASQLEPAVNRRVDAIKNTSGHLKNETKNTSNYLAVFAGNNLEIQLNRTLNYFGINWGAAHAGNTYSFFRGNQLVQAFTTKDIEDAGGFAFYSTFNPGGGEGAKAGGQGNGYVHFKSQSKEGLFDRILISQVGGGGFETDNHSFRVGSRAFDERSATVPEPGVVLGLIGVGAAFLNKRKKSAING